MTSAANSRSFSLTYLGALQGVRYHMVASLASVIWDVLLTSGDEVEVIWRMRNCWSKWLYVYLRYFPVVAQIFHHAVFSKVSSGNLPDDLCRLWYLYMALSLQIMVAIVEVILATRVFALFNRNRKVGVFLGMLILPAVICNVVSLTRYDDNATMYFETCMLPHPTDGAALALSVTIFLVSLGIMVAMTVFKHVVAIRSGWGRTPLVSLLVRDATSVYVVIFLMGGVSMIIRMIDFHQSVGAFFWLISFYSATGSRLILSMEGFARRNSVEEERDIVLTSHITL